MAFMPAGMSDTESDDGDFYSLNETNEGRYNDKIRNNKRLESNDTCKKKYTQNEEKISETSVINACASGSFDIIKGYLESHNVDDYLHTGWTLLLYAATATNSEMIENLLSCGADPNRHKDGYTPLMALCNSHCNSEDRSLKCLGLLIDAKANVHAYTSQSETALMFACKSQTLIFVTELLKHVKDIDFRDTSKRTALMYAVLENRVEIIKLLVESGADVANMDNTNSTCIDIAYQKGYTEVLRFLDPDYQETIEDYEKQAIPTWDDILSTVKNDKEIDFDVSTMLYGMSLESYSKCFTGMCLKSFLQQTEKDLISVGIDISAQRRQFIQNLHKFHKRKWAAKSVGPIDKSMPYTVYDAVVTLNTVTKHTGIINSTFGYMKTCLPAGTDINQYFDKKKRLEYQGELEIVKQTVNKLQMEIAKLNILTKKMCKEKRIDIPPYYIGLRKRNKSNWLWLLSSAVIIGMCISKVTWVQVQTSVFVKNIPFYWK